MQKMMFCLIGGLLMAGFAAAQQQSASVEDVLRQLGEVPQVEAAPAPEQAETAERRGWFGRRRDREAEREEAEAMPPVEVDDPSVEEAPVMQFDDPQPDVDVPAVLDASRALYVGGEFERAQRGFEMIVRQEPDHPLANIYLRRIKEREHRRAQVASIQAVDDAWDGRMVLRTYPVSGEGQRKMELDEVEEPLCVIRKFPEVDFPDGSAAVYQPTSGNLHIRNTRDNLAVLEEILDAMDIANHRRDIDQVEIEAKFVEVSQGVLQELGFEWNNLQGLTRDNIDVIDGQDLFSGALRSVPFDRPEAMGINQGMGMTGAGAGAWRAFRFEDTFNTEAAELLVQRDLTRRTHGVDLLMRALDQRAGTDVLSAPRIVTRSGRQATIQVGNLHYFPNVFEVGESEGNIIHVEYVGFEETLLGIELTVNPIVDGDQITLRLNPKVNELLGWQNYRIAPGDGIYSTRNDRIGLIFYSDPVEARLPVIKRREIQTEATIANGSTMGMGGLINERVESFSDRVPVLGGVPLLGRLFRSEGERTVKRNLMIFVTATKVNPTGRMAISRTFE